jgi:hypothetical protein
MQNVKAFTALTTIALLASAHAAPVTRPGAYYVTTDSATVRLAPSAHGKATNVLYKRSKVDVQEVRTGWARMGSYYPGDSEGLPGQQVARWVEVSALDSVQPPEERARPGEPEVAQYIKSGDNFAKHRAVFVKASNDLIERHVCKLADFKEQGGWLEDPDARPAGTVYFTYCGEMTRANRLRLDVRTGKVSHY